jgi:hypothetical protein
MNIRLDGSSLSLYSVPDFGPIRPIDRALQFESES